MRTEDHGAEVVKGKNEIKIRIFHLNQYLTSILLD